MNNENYGDSHELIAFFINCRMRNQSSLVVLAVVLLAIASHALPSVSNEKVDEVDNAIEKDDKLFKPDPKIPKAMDPRFNKMLPLPKLNELDTSTKAEKVSKGQKSSTTEKAVKADETSTIGNSRNHGSLR